MPQAPLAWMASAGVLDLFLPLLVFFTVLFALLQASGMFERKLNAVISLAISLLIVLPHTAGSYPVGSDPVLILNKILPGAGVLTIVILLALMLLGFTGFQVFSPGSGVVGILGIIALALVVLNAVLPNKLGLKFLNDPTLQSAIIVILVFGLVVWFVMGSGEPATGQPKGFSEWLRDFASTARPRT